MLFVDNLQLSLPLKSPSGDFCVHTFTATEYQGAARKINSVLKTGSSLKCAEQSAPRFELELTSHE